MSHDTPPPSLPLSLQDVLDSVELRTRRSSSSAFTDSPAHSRHGGSPLHFYLPGKAAYSTKDTHIHGKYEVPSWQYERAVRAGAGGCYEPQNSQQHPMNLTTHPNTHTHAYIHVPVCTSSAYKSVCLSFLFGDVGHSVPHALVSLTVIGCDDGRQ